MADRVDYAKLSRNVFDVLNKLRRNPQTFISKLENRLKYFKGNDYRPPNLSIAITTNEGSAAVKNAIEELERLKPLPELKWVDGIAKACADHANDIGAKNLFSHKGSDGSASAERLARYGQFKGPQAETIDFYNYDPEEVVFSLLIDDGNEQRSNRLNILNPKFQFCGVAAARHAEAEICVVINFASDYTEVSKKPEGKPSSKDQASKNSVNYEKLAKEVFEAQNRLRRDPKSFIPKLTYKMMLFDGNKYKVPGEITIVTAEGPDAVQEAINALKKQPPLQELKYKEGLAKAARDHANDIGAHGTEAHTGTDGSRLGDRIDRYGKWMGKIGENIDFTSTDADEIIMDLLIDDGNSSRGHRKNLLNPEFAATGVAIAKHLYRGICVVIDYAGEFQDSLDGKPKQGKDHPKLLQKPEKFHEPLDEIGKSMKMDPDNLNRLARSVFDFQNKVRRDPKCLIPKLEADLKRFKGNELHLPGYIPISTEEGPKAYREAISFLETAQPVAELEWNDGIFKACLDHAIDIGEAGTFNHKGTDGSKLSTRLERYGAWKGAAGESIDFASYTKEDILISLIVDDGNPSRGHRKNVFNPKFKTGAVAASRHIAMDICFVFDYTGEFIAHNGNVASHGSKKRDSPKHSSGDYSKLAKEVYIAQNRLRKDPASFIPLLEEKLKYFEGKTLKIPGEIALVTNEGPAAVKEAIQHLRNQKSLPELKWNASMAQAAQDHAHDIGPKGSFSHSGSDGSDLSARLDRYGEWNGKIGENIDFGTKDAYGAVASLLIDDGNKGRGHRKNLLSPDFAVTGVGVSKHAEMDICIVIDYASEYQPHK